MEKQMADIAGLLTTQRPYLTDGGFETWLFFQQGFEAPEFAAIVLMEDPKARQAMRRYFDQFLQMAETANTGFILDANTWRGCTSWAPKLGQSEAELLALSQNAVEFAKEIQNEWQSKVKSVLVNGVVGPFGDGYKPEELGDIETARKIHAPQIKTIVDFGVDMISAITMTNIDEAAGIAQEAASCNTPVVISFTVETDGRLPTGDTLEEDINAVDSVTNNAPLYYMINCAHPDHLLEMVSEGGNWVSRLGGIRANASRLSHAELDVAETLDVGDPDEFGLLHVELSRVMPNLRVFGGWCGTDHRHVERVSSHLHRVDLSS
jgi:homocysteine S-methyltransferase